MDYTGLTQRINIEIENILRENWASLNYSYFRLDAELEIWLRASLNLVENKPNTLSEFHYLPPCLMLYVCGAAGGDIEDALQLAAAIQFMHRASTILDDVQDQDNKEALASKLGVGKALNIGLILLSLGQASLCSSLDKFNQKKGKDKDGNNYFYLASKLLQSISVGSRGQLIDLQEQGVSKEARLESPQAYITKIGLKTALTASRLAEMGAKLGGADDETVEIYGRFGWLFGITIHLLDDLKDFIKGLEDPENSPDAKQEYLSLAFIYAYQELDKSREFRLEWEQNKDCKALFKARTAFWQTLGQITQYIAQAEEELRLLDPKLKRIEHQILIEKLKNFAQNLYLMYSKHQEN